MQFTETNINSALLNFYPSYILIYLVFVKKYAIKDNLLIQEKIQHYFKNSNKFKEFIQILTQCIYLYNSYKIPDELYDYLRKDGYFLIRYKNISYNALSKKNIFIQKLKEKQKIPTLNKHFYQGFGIDIK